MPFANLSDVRLYYEVLGQGEPLMMIPGLGGTCRTWDLVASQLAEQFTLILPDNRGIGHSVPKRQARNITDFSSDLIELLDELQLDRVHLLGISMGGVIAQKMAVDHPSRLNRLVLMSTAHRFGPYLRDIARLLGHSLHRMPRWLFHRTVELLGTAPSFYDRQAEDRSLSTTPVDPVEISRSALRTQLKCLAAEQVVDGDYSITAPTLVLAGEYDALIPNCYSRALAQMSPGSRFQLISGCGHNPASEQPDLVAPLIADFLNSSETTMRQIPSPGIPQEIGDEPLARGSFSDISRELRETLDPISSKYAEEYTGRGSRRHLAGKERP